MAVLTEPMILAKCRNNTLKHIKNLNFWGSDLSDVSILQTMPQLEIVSLSVNNIDTLHCFTHLPNLSELYLRKNSIPSDQLFWLAHMPNLKVLWLSENPCSSDPSYRARVVSFAKNLLKLDDVVVTDKERHASPPPPSSAALQPTTSMMHHNLTPPPPLPKHDGNVDKQPSSPQPNTNSKYHEMMDMLQHPQEPSRHDDHVRNASPFSTNLPQKSTTPWDRSKTMRSITITENQSSQHNHHLNNNIHQVSGLMEAANTNVMYAIMALLKELNPHELMLIGRRIEQMLDGHP